MELYYKDLISKEASLEKLVDNLMLVVQGADELASAAGANLPPEHKQELTARLHKLKEGCRRVKQHAIDSALATDRVLHQYPYSALGFAFAFGILAGVLIKKSR